MILYICTVGACGHKLVHETNQLQSTGTLIITNITESLYPVGRHYFSLTVTLLTHLLH